MHLCNYLAGISGDSAYAFIILLLRSKFNDSCRVCLTQAFLLDIPSKTQGEKTKTQAKKTQNSRIFHPKLKIPAIFSEI